MKHDFAYYRAIQGMEGAASAKEAEIRAIKFEVLRDFGNSIDCEDVTINGESSSLLITKTTDRTIKNIAAKPDETVYYGDIVHWLSDDWIVDVIDSDDRINIHGKMRRCNVVLRWVDEFGVTHAYPGYCEDATKYSEGVTGGKFAQTPDFQIKVKIRTDANSVKIDRGRRFLLDAPSSAGDPSGALDQPSAFIVTRRNVITGNHRGHGYAELTLIECAFSENDNASLMIADYYRSDDAYVVSIENATSPLSLPVGTDYTLTATVTKNGAPDQTVILFKSSDERIATVSATGEISAIAEGECDIVVSAGKAREVILLKVIADATGYHIRVDPVDGDFTIAAGAEKLVRVYLYDGDIRMPHEFVSLLLDMGDVAEIKEVSPNAFVLRVNSDESLYGKNVRVRVIQPDLTMYKDVSFQIAGWF